MSAASMPAPYGPPWDEPCERCGVYHTQGNVKGGKPKCRAHSKRTGNACARWPVVGGVTCTSHGSGTKAARQKGRERKVLSFQEGKIAQLLKECDVQEKHPLDGLLEVVRHAGGMMRMLGGLVGELAVHPSEQEESWSMSEDGELVIRKEGALYGPDHTGDAAPSVLVQLYGIWSDRYARACKLALDANIDERLVHNAESTSEALFTALGKALDAAELTPAQRGKLQSALAQELRRHTGMDALAREEIP